MMKHDLTIFGSNTAEEAPKYRDHLAFPCYSLRVLKYLYYTILLYTLIYTIIINKLRALKTGQRLSHKKRKTVLQTTKSENFLKNIKKTKRESFSEINKFSKKKFCISLNLGL